MDDLMLSNCLAELVAEFIEQLLVVVRRDVRPKPTEEPAVGRWQLHQRDWLQSERGREVGFEERLEYLIREDDHPEGGEVAIRLIRLDLWGRLPFFFFAFRSRKQSIPVFESVRHESTDSAKIRIANLEPEYKLIRSQN